MTEGHGVGRGHPARRPVQRTGPQAGRRTAGGAIWRWRPQSPEGAPAPGSRMGAPAVETRPASSRENARQNVQFCAEDMVARRDSGYVSPVRPPPYGRSNGVCNVFRAIRNIDTLFGDTS